MQKWKQVFIFTAVGAGAMLALSGRRNLGLASMAGGLALLASEHPERFESVLESAPHYVNRASQIFDALNRITEKFEESQRRSADRMQLHEKLG